MSPLTTEFIAALIVLIWLLFGPFKFAESHERFVVLRWEPITGVRGPGFTFIIPPFEKAVRVDLRNDSVERPPVQNPHGRTARYSGKITRKVVDPVKSVAQVYAVPHSVKSLAEKWLASAASAVPWGQVVIHEKDLEERLAAALREEFASCGLELAGCEICDIRPV